MTLISPDGSPIDGRLIQRHELGKVLLRCLPDGGGIEMLFKTQETIGMAAWDGDQCIAQLHCYRLVLPPGAIGQPGTAHSTWRLCSMVV